LLDRQAAIAGDAAYFRCGRQTVALEFGMIRGWRNRMLKRE
jgi:hypothetical protein